MLINQINWDEVIATLVTQDGQLISPDPSRWNLDNKEYSVIYKQWVDAKFNPASIKWTNYYPGVHYDQQITDKLKQLLNLKGVHRSWISRVDPGFYSPWHWDVDDNESTYLEKGPILRYSCFIGKPNPCHVFVTESMSYTRAQQGTIVKWDNYNDWHAGMNAGLEPKFMLHLLGY